MYGLNIIVLIILAACIFPYIFSAIARKSAGYRAKIHGHPREFMAQATGFAARANAVQYNSFENLPLFLVAILMAEYLVVPPFYTIVLGIAYLCLRVLYGIFYLLNWSALRSVMWLLATLCPVTLLLLCVKIS